MSLKGPLRRLTREVEWLEDVGTFRHLETILELLELKQEMADNLARDKEKTAEFERLGLLRTLDLPPPSWAKQEAPRPEPIKALEPTKPHLEESRPEPILRDAALQAAPQDVVRVEAVAPSPPLSPEPTPPHREEPSCRFAASGGESGLARRQGAFERERSKRPEGCEPAPAPEPPLVQPFVPPSPDMQIRPVTWRRRGALDYDDDPDDMYGKCIVDYDPLAEHFRQDDDEDD